MWNAPTIKFRSGDKVYEFPAAVPSDAKRADWRKEEDESFAGPDTVEQMLGVVGETPELYEDLAGKYGIENWQGWFMLFSTEVARHYGVSKDQVQKYWLERYGLGNIQRQMPEEWRWSYRCRDGESL